MRLALRDCIGVLVIASLVVAGNTAARNRVTKEFVQKRKDEIRNEPRSRRQTSTRFDCDGCLRDSSLRVLFIEVKDIVENEEATRAASGRGYSCGSCCSDPERAVPDCFVAENWNTGWIAKPMMDIFVNTAAKIVALTPANFTAEARELSLDQTPYSICTHEVLLGNVDICVGDIWETLERRSIVPFTTPLEVNIFKLVTLAVDQQEFTPYRLLDMFKPFSPGIWGMMTAMFVFMAVVMWLLSEDGSEEFEQDELFPDKRGVLKSLWVAAMGYLAGNQFTSNSWSSRMVVLGFSFFLATMVAAYTANLASFMVQRPKDTGIVSSLADIVVRKRTLCSVADVRYMLTEPGIQERFFIEDPSMGSVFEHLRRGTCDAALVGSMEYLLYVQAATMRYDICTTPEDPNFLGGFACVRPDSQLTRYDLTECQCGDDVPLYDIPPAACPQHCVAPNSKFCDVVEVLDPTLSAGFNYGLPAAAWVEPYVSAGIVASKISGAFAQDFKDELIATNPPSCPEESAQGRLNNAQLNSANSLNLTFMSGTFFFSVVVMVFGMLLHAAVKLSARHSAQPSPASSSGHDLSHARDVAHAVQPRQDSPRKTEPTGGERKPSVLKLQTKQSIAELEQQVGSMGSDYRELQRDIAAVLAGLTDLRHNQTDAQHASAFSRSGRVPGASFQGPRGGGAAAGAEEGEHSRHNRRRTRR